MNFIDLDLFFKFLKGRCHGSQLWAKLAKLLSLNTLAFRNAFEYRNFDLQVLNGNIFATLYAIMMKIGQVTQDIRKVKTAPFWTRGPKSAYHNKYLSKYWTDRY